MSGKLDVIKGILESDLTAADLTLSLFFSAAVSYKKKTLLKPFPKSYQTAKDDTSEENFDKLTSDLNEICNLEELYLQILNNTEMLSDDVVNLVHTILVMPKYHISTLPKRQHENILKLCETSNPATGPPNFIFKVNYTGSGAEKRFQQLATTGFEKKFAYHGTRFYNLYSILNHGLQQHLNKTGLFGEGLYFAEELELSLLFSPSVVGWSKSRIGEVVRSVAVCEYLDDPLYVKTRKENSRNSDIPQKYLLITNNEIVRVRYLLIYSTKKSSAPKAVESTAKENQGLSAGDQRTSTSIFQWACRNPFIISVLLYVLLLFVVGMSNNRAVEYYKNAIISFLKKRLKFL